MENDATPPTQSPTLPQSRDRDINTIGMLCHLLALCAFLGVPLGNIVGPLIIWLIKREDSPFIDACGKESINFQISMSIYTIVAGLLIFAFIGILLLPALLILNLVLTIIASLAASEGKEYTYPMTIRFIK